MRRRPRSTSGSAARPSVGRTSAPSSAASTSAARCRAPSWSPRPASRGARSATLVGELAAAGLVREEDRRPPRDAGPAVAARPPRPDRRRRARPRDPRRLASPSPSSASAARPSSSVRIDRPRGHLSVDDVVADLAALARRAAGATPERPARRHRRRRRRRRPPRATAWSSMAPNLGWIDVPLGARLARALAVDRPDRGRQRRRPRRPRRAPSGRGGRRGRRRCYVSGEVGVGGGVDRRRPPADRHRRVRRRDRPHAGQPGRARHVAAASVGCWETEVGEGRCSRSRGLPAGRRTGRRRRRARARPPPARPRPWRRSSTSAAGSASAWPASSTSSTRGSSCWAGMHGRILPVRAARSSRRSWPRASARRARAPGPGRAGRARRRCAAARRGRARASSRCSPIRPPGSRRATRALSWRAPDRWRPAARPDHAPAASSRASTMKGVA